MRAQVILMAALTAPALSGCGGFGVGDLAPPAPIAAPPPPSTVGAPPPSAAVAPSPSPVAAVAPPPPPALPPIPTGAALGGVLGGPIGASLTDADRQAAWNAQIAALESGQRRSWRGAHGVFGLVEPGAETGASCRSYAQTIYVAGRPNRGEGVACKQTEGGWRMAS